MINRRYHIVSITAVFLALGIGITMGSTFLGRGALERIDQNVKNAQEQVRRTNKENADLKREAELEADRAEGFMSEGTQRMFEGDLEEVPTLVLAAPGIDQDLPRPAHRHREDAARGGRGRGHGRRPQCHVA